jgi:hypothetical protein
MSETSTLIGYSGRTIGREELALMPTPPATETHRPIPHHEIVQALVETLGFRQIGVVHDEYAVSPDGMKMFGVLDLATEMSGCRFSIGLRNSHNKSMRLAMTCGYRVFVCSNMAFSGDFTPVLAKHSKSFSLIDCISVGVDRMQRNFDPMRKQVEACGRRVNSPRSRPRWSFRRRSSKPSWKLPNISPVRFTICILNRNTRNFVHGRSGVFRTRLLRRSNNWIPSAVQVNCKTGRVSGSPVLPVVLALRGYRPDRRSFFG